MMNVQICTLANNHIYDFGVDGLKETLEMCQKHNIRTVGAGLNIQDVTMPLLIEDNEIRVAVITFAENEFNTIDLYEKGVGSNNLDLLIYVIKLRMLNLILIM